MFFSTHLIIDFRFIYFHLLFKYYMCFHSSTASFIIVGFLERSISGIFIIAAITTSIGKKIGVIVHLILCFTIISPPS